MESENRITARWVCPGGAKSAFSEPEISREPRKASAWPWPALLDKILLLPFCPHKADHHIQENELKTGKVINKAEVAKGNVAKDHHSSLQKCGGLGLDEWFVFTVHDLGLSSPPNLNAKVLS